MAPNHPPSSFSFPPFLILTLIILTTFPSNSNSQPNPDLHTLLQIKQSWSNPSSLTSWTASTPVCKWTGILCSQTGSVTGLNLPNLNLSGPIPTTLCNLPNLSFINLYNNFLSGPFPISLYNCTTLTHLDLSDNLFIGTLPVDIHRLPRSLTALILSGNNFTGALPSSIGQLNIQELYMDNNLFNGPIPSELGNLTNLEKLDLAFNPFPAMSVPSQIANLTRLTYLWMTGANLTGQIPSFFKKMTALQHLDLGENSLNGTMPAWIWDLDNLNYLYLYKNEFTGEINPTKIGAMGLREIDVSINQLTGSIPESFGNLHNLSVLYMYNNMLSGPIPLSIALLPSLIDLKLFNNKLTGPLPPDLGKHSPLWNLELDNNWITGELPENLCAHGALTGLVVFDNNLTGNLPASLGSCSTLNSIQIHYNRLSGEVPAGIWSAVNLSVVIMRDNELSGELPDLLPRNLARLNIQNNFFSGNVPSSAGNLLVFAGGNNQFSGEIPDSIASGMPLLQTLSLSANQLTGEIPLEISQLKSLTELNLSSNQLIGEIPVGIGSLPVLTSLDLSNNQLSGEIPIDLGNLKLNFLNLSYNDLSGKIPAALINAADNSSFLSNPELCVNNSCNNGSGSSGLSNALRDFFLIGGVLLLMIIAGFAFLLVRSYRGKAGWDAADWKLTSFHSLNFSELAIVRGLTDENLIGSGGSGKVYKVTFSSRTGGMVAVKKIWNSRKVDSKLEQEFESEVKILGSIRHLNIVKLLACVSSADSKLLVYEYMENGSLDRWLRPAGGVPPGRAGSRRAGRLDWRTRLGIAIGAAQGLSYMHHDCSPAIMHRDVKSSNILLDSEFRAQIADFGLARMLARAGEPDSVSCVAGSFGYMAPECAYTRKVNEKVDVYSFGVVLLELTTGKEANDGGSHGSLAEWAWRHFQEGNKLESFVDDEIRDPLYLAEIAVVLKLGLICTGTLPSTRPTMKDVVQMLLRCDQTMPVVGDKPLLECDVVPLLQPKKGSRRVKPSDVHGEDSVSCNV